MHAACYTILRTALEELMRVGVIAPRQVFFDYKTSVLLQNDVNRLSVVLLQVANACQGFSGRTIRKLPFLGTPHNYYLSQRVILLSICFVSLSVQHTLFISKLQLAHQPSSFGP